MKRAIAIVGLVGQFAVLAIQFHCPMAGIAGHSDAITAIAHVDGHNHGHGVTADRASAVPADDRPATSPAGCAMASGCLASTAVLAGALRVAAPSLSMFDSPSTISTIESATRQHTTPPPRQPVLFA